MLDYTAAGFFLSLGIAVGAGGLWLFKNVWKVRRGVVIEVERQHESVPQFFRLDGNRPIPTYFDVAVRVRNRMDAPLTLISLDFLTVDGGRVLVDTFEAPEVIPPHQSEAWAHARHDSNLKGTYAILATDGAGRTWKVPFIFEPDPV